MEKYQIMLDRFKEERRKIRENLELKEALRNTKKALDVIFIGFLIFFGVIIFLFYKLFFPPTLSIPTIPTVPTSIGDSELTNLTINLNGLNESEKVIANLLINEIRLSFLKKQKSITFTNNISENYTGDAEPEKLNGFSDLNGNNYIKFKVDIPAMRRTITHELSHTYCRGRDNETHEFIYALSKSCPAFNGGCK